MAKVKVGDLIKEARTKKGLSQAALAEQIDGLSASDISKAERGEKELSTDILKAIAKATGVTQKSLLEAAAGTATTSGKTSGSSSGKTSGTSSASGTSGTNMKLTAQEKTLVELFRKADADTKKQVLTTLKGKNKEVEELMNSILGNAMGMLLKKDK